MATFVKGHSFITNETVNDVDLHELVESGTVSGIDRPDIDNTLGHLGLVSLLKPSDLNDQEPWAHSDQLWWITHISGESVSMRVGGIQVTLDAASITLAPGELVIPSSFSDPDITVTRAGKNDLGSTKVYGIAAEAISPGSKGVIVTHGITAVRMASDAETALRGRAIRLSSSEAGLADRLDVAGSGYGPMGFGKFITNSFTGISGATIAWVSFYR